MNRVFRRIPIIDYTSQELANVSSILIVDSDYFIDKNTIVVALLMIQNEEKHDDKRGEFGDSLFKEYMRCYCVNLLNLEVTPMRIPSINMCKSKCRFVRFLEVSGIEDYKVSVIPDHCKTMVYHFK